MNNEFFKCQNSACLQHGVGSGIWNSEHAQKPRLINMSQVFNRWFLTLRFSKDPCSLFL